MSSSTPTHPARSQPIRLAIVGCGAVSERFHGASLRGFDGFAPTVAVDRDPARAALLAGYFPGCAAETDFVRLKDARVDAAIVALPVHVNALAATALVRHGISVLVEKPVAATVAEARALEAAAAESGATVAVGFIRRESVAVRFAKRMIESGMLGAIKSVSIEDGYLYSWQAVQGFRFERDKGGGILFDIGTHVLDMLSFWFGDVRIKRYEDNAEGGVDTDARVAVEICSDVPGTVELSWTRTLRNTARIECTLGSLEVEWYRNRATLELSDSKLSFAGTVTSDARLTDGGETFPAMFLAQLARWHASLVGHNKSWSMADAADGWRNIELIEQCRSIRQPMRFGWKSFERA
jgi:predicted dehydrogenase